MPSSTHNVLVIPGLMGSELFFVDSDTGQRRQVWGGRRSTIVSAMSRNAHLLTLKEVDFIEPGNVIEEATTGATGRGRKSVYKILLDHLQTSPLNYTLNRDMWVFAYDWRRDLREIASELGEFVRRTGPYQGKPWNVVAHSMGSLVIRLALEQGNVPPSTVATVVELGGPKLGASGAFLALNNLPGAIPWFSSGILKLPLSGLGYFVREFQHKVLKSFPSLYQLMPHDTESVMVQNGKTTFHSVFKWPGWLRYQRGVLRDAQTTSHVILSATHSGPSFVAGYSQDFPTRHELQYETASRSWAPTLLADGDGDGTVVNASALQGSDQILSRAFNASHRDLVIDQTVLNWLNGIL